jgi:hypothetical protein
VPSANQSPRQFLGNTVLILLVVVGFIYVINSTDGEDLAGLLIPGVAQLVLTLVAMAVAQPGLRSLRGVGFLVIGTVLLGLSILRVVTDTGEGREVLLAAGGVAAVLIAFGVARRLGRWDRRPGSGMRVGAVMLVALALATFGSDAFPRILVLLPIPVCVWLAGAQLERAPDDVMGRVALMTVPAPGGGVAVSVMALVTDRRAGRNSRPAWWALAFSSVTTLVLFFGNNPPW